MDLITIKSNIIQNYPLIVVFFFNIITLNNFVILHVKRN